MKLWDETIDGYRPEARAMLAALAEAFPAAGGDLPEDPVARAQIQRQNMIDFEPEPSPMAVESTIPGPAGDIPARLFEPDEPKAMFLHIHGGGWIIGRPQMNDPANEHLATHHGLAVLSVDYRLAPEHPYPAGPDDCEAAAAWMLEHGPERWGTDKMFIGGESAGGHLAAATLLRVRDRLGAIDRVSGRQFGVRLVRPEGHPFDLRQRRKSRHFGPGGASIHDRVVYPKHVECRAARSRCVAPVRRPLRPAPLSGDRGRQ